MPVPVIGGLLGRAGIAGAKYLSKKMVERSAKKAAQEKVKDGISDLEKVALTGAVGKGLAVTAFDKDQRRKEDERKRAEKAKTEEEKEVDGMRSGGRVSGSSMGGSVRGGGCEIRGKTKGRMV